MPVKITKGLQDLVRKWHERPSATSVPLFPRCRPHEAQRPITTDLATLRNGMEDPVYGRGYASYILSTGRAAMATDGHTFVMVPTHLEPGLYRLGPDTPPEFEQEFDPRGRYLDRAGAVDGREPLSFSFPDMLTLLPQEQDVNATMVFATPDLALLCNLAIAYTANLASACSELRKAENKKYGKDWPSDIGIYPPLLILGPDPTDPMGVFVEVRDPVSEGKKERPAEMLEVNDAVRDVSGPFPNWPFTTGRLVEGELTRTGVSAKYLLRAIKGSKRVRIDWVDEYSVLTVSTDNGYLHGIMPVRL